MKLDLLKNTHDEAETHKFVLTAQAYFADITGKAMKLLLASTYAEELLGPHAKPAADGNAKGSITGDKTTTTGKGAIVDPAENSGMLAGTMAKQHAEFLAATARQQMKLAGRRYASAVATAVAAKDALNDNIVESEKTAAELKTASSFAFQVFWLADRC